MSGDKIKCPFNGVTNYYIVWRKGAGNEARSASVALERIK